MRGGKLLPGWESGVGFLGSDMIVRMGDIS